VITVPINNDDLGQYLYKQFSMRGTQQLFCDLKVDKDQDWLRPNELRQTYAIRCSVHSTTFHVPMTIQPKWMGHGVEVHERSYLRWINAERGLAGMQAWLENQLEAKKDDKDALQASMNIPEVQAQPESTSAPDIDPQQLEEMMQEIAKLKEVNSRQKKMIDALQEEDE